jgi:VanZ family protein
MRLPHPVFALGYALALSAVVVLSLIPSPELPGPEGSDKAAHLIAYGAIALCGGLGFRDWDTRILAASAAISIGILLELAQAAWFARHGSAWDAAANGLGAVLGLIVAALVLQAFMQARSGRNV